MATLLSFPPQWSHLHCNFSSCIKLSKTSAKKKRVASKITVNSMQKVKKEEKIWREKNLLIVVFLLPVVQVVSVNIALVTGGNKNVLSIQLEIVM